MVSKGGEASTLLLMLLSSKLRFLFLFNLLLLFVVCWVLNSLSSIRDSLTQSIWQIDIDDPILMNLSAESFIQSIQVIIHIPFILSSRLSSLHDRSLRLNFHPFIRPFFRPSLYPLIGSSIHPSIYPSLYPSIHPNMRHCFQCNLSQHLKSKIFVLLLIFYFKFLGFYWLKRIIPHQTSNRWHEHFPV